MQKIQFKTSNINTLYISFCFKRLLKIQTFYKVDFIILATEKYSIQQNYTVCRLIIYYSSIKTKIPVIVYIGYQLQLIVTQKEEVKISTLKLISKIKRNEHKYQSTIVSKLLWHIVTSKNTSICLKYYQIYVNAWSLV